MIIALVNLKGGVAKTTSAIYIAAAAARRGTGPVLLVDTDPQGSAAEWLELSPIDGVQLLEAPSERMLASASGYAGPGATMIIDTPPNSDRLAVVAAGLADAVAIPTRTGGVEPSRVQATLDTIPDGKPRGLVICGAQVLTRVYAETVEGWRAAGMPIWATIPQRVAIAAGPDAPLLPEAIDAYEQVLAATAATI